MKSAAAYYLILLYAVAVCKPFLPVVSDFLAHTFWNAEHIEAVHHTHGANHVHYELKEAAKQEKESTTSHAVSEPVPVHIPVQNSYDFSLADSATQRPVTSLYAITHSFLEIHTPPPKV